MQGSKRETAQQMHSSKHRNLNMKNQGSVSLTRLYNNSANESKDNELAEVSEKEFRSLLLKMVNNLKEDSNK
jgi:hypothetical protein